MSTNFLPFSTHFSCGFVSIQAECQALSMNKISWSFCYAEAGMRAGIEMEREEGEDLLLFYLVWCKLHAIFALDIIYGVMQWTPMTIPIHVVSCYWCHTKCKYTNKDQAGVHTLSERDWYVPVLNVYSSTWLHGTWHESRNINNIWDAHTVREAKETKFRLKTGIE